MMSFLGSSVGKKYLMGLTGIVWAGFLASHMLGNFLLFVSADAYNNYSHKLITNPLILVAEFVLVAAFIVHVFTAISLTIANKKAKQMANEATAQGEKAPAKASRMMAIHGLFILAFVILHLIGFKYGPYYETTLKDGTVVRDIFAVVVEVFKNPYYLVWYLFCLILLGLHLSHGVQSIFQSLGFLSYTNQQTIKKFSIGYAIVIALGFISQPLFVYFVY